MELCRDAELYAMQKFTIMLLNLTKTVRFGMLN